MRNPRRHRRRRGRDTPRAERVLVAAARSRCEAPRAVNDEPWVQHSGRSIRSRPAGEAAGLAPVADAEQTDPPPPGDVRSDRPAADAGRGRRLRHGPVAGGVRRRSSIAARLARISANAGAGTGSTSPATPTRPARTTKHRLSTRLAVSRLRHRRVQRRHAVRPVRPRADRRRPAARDEPEARREHRHRLPGAAARRT